MDEDKGTFPDAFVHEILALLDRIEVEKNPALAIQRLAIAEKNGMKIVFGEPVSGAMN